MSSGHHVKIECLLDHINLGDKTVKCKKDGSFEGSPNCSKIRESIVNISMGSLKSNIFPITMF